MNMRDIMNLLEVVNPQDMVLYHGTDSAAPFSSYDPASAGKAQKWNPLGAGMYATNSYKFALNFGRAVHKVLLPAGSTYRKVTQRQWGSTIGQKIIDQALATVFQTVPKPEPKPLGKLKWAMNYVLASSSPFDSLLGCYQIVKDQLGDEAAQIFSDTVPQISQKTFGRYDFVIFTDTIGGTPDWDAATGKSITPWEVVIFNKKLQKTVLGA
jgi:hypothetical protein